MRHFEAVNAIEKRRSLGISCHGSAGMDPQATITAGETPYS
jgi:hypothetical protein